MAKARAICTCEACGRSFEKVTIKHNRTEADGWEAWATKHYTLCPECYREKQMELAKSKAAEAGLPELTGTPKQIAWAEKIREKLWADYLDIECELSTSDPGNLELEAMFAACRSVFQTVTSAKDYIERRGCSADEFLNLFETDRHE